jgi:serine/threonine-protein kinase
MRPETTALLGQMVGHIRIAGVIGEGGMGAVYTGFDDTLKRRVAVKAIHSHYRLKEHAKARFLREARILSRLDHPNICRVHDFIEGDDTDFLVMELVEGSDLRVAVKLGLEIADKLDIADQLLEVLAAVHNQGVIHRDLKPANVMITPERHIKVLDFGLARSIEEEIPWSGTTLSLEESAEHVMRPAPTSPADETSYVRTKLGTILGTVGYMSPEQARGEPATSASDMYSLGLALQELFTERRPFEDGLSREEMLESAALGETVPVAGLPSDLTGLINRMKSVAPGSRPSARDALEHLRRIVDKPKRRRRRLIVAAVWILIVGFGVGMGVQSFRAQRQAARARAETARAQREAAKSEAINRFLQEVLASPDPFSGSGRQVTVLEALRKAVERIDADFVAQPDVKASVMNSVGEIFRKLGRYDEAEELLTSALETRRDLFNQDHTEVADSLFNLASVHHDTGDLRLAETEYREALNIRERLLGAGHRDVALVVNSLARVARDGGDVDGAEALFRKALEMQRHELGDRDTDVAETLTDLAQLLRFKGELEQAEALSREGLDINLGRYGREHPAVAISLSVLGQVLFERGDYGEAEKLFRESIKIDRAVYGEYHEEVAGSLAWLGHLLKTSGRPHEAAPVLKQGLEIYRRTLGDDHEYVAVSLLNLAVLHRDQRQYDEALPLYREALRLFRKSLEPGHWAIFNAQSSYGLCLFRLGRYQEAERELLDSFDGLAESLGRDHEKTAWVGARLVELYEAQGKDPEADRYRKAAQ